MKITTPEEERAHQDANVSGAIRGVMLSAGVGVPAHFALSRFSSVYRVVPLPLKALGYTALSVMTISISAEKAGEAYDRAQYSGAGQRALEARSQAREKSFGEMSLLEKTGDFAKRWKFPIIGASWAGVLGGSYALISRDKSMTVAQRLVQARVYAQAWTVVCLLAAIAASQTSHPDDDEDRVYVHPHHHKEEDHSWRDMIPADQLDKANAAAPAKHSAEHARGRQLEDAAHLSRPKRGE